MEERFTQEGFMFGVIVNALAVIIGSGLGLLLRRGLPQKFTDGLMQALSLCVIVIGILGLNVKVDSMAIILSIVLGSLIGIALNIDGAVRRLGETMDRRLKNTAPDGGHTLGEGFVTATLLFCIGAMTVTGSLRSGLEGDHSILFAKSALDFITSILLTSAVGIGVMLSSLSVLIIQGGIVLLARLVAPLFTEPTIMSISCVGSVLILALGLNMLNITKFKPADMLPSLILAPFMSAFMALF